MVKPSFFAFSFFFLCANIFILPPLLLIFSTCMKINRLAVFFVCLLFFFFCFVFFFQQISDRQSLFLFEETLKCWVQVIIFLRKEQNSILALNL